METKIGRLFIVDLSGYTRFLTNTSLLHAREVITKILEKLYECCPEELILNKIEGDALFFYSEKLSKEDLIDISKKIDKRFHDTITQLSPGHKTCSFKFCQNLSALHIKFFIHEGEYALHKIGEFEELIGIPVIEIHRLLKNNVKKDSYILIVDKEGKFSMGYEHIGEIRFNIIELH